MFSRDSIKLSRVRGIDASALSIFPVFIKSLGVMAVPADILSDSGLDGFAIRW